MLLPTSDLVLALFGTIGTPELIVIAIIGLLIFGRRLPEVGKSIGRSIVSFKEGLAGIEDDVDSAGKKSAELDDQSSPSVDASSEKKSQPVSK